MIVGKPGFGKTTLAKYAGEMLKFKHGIDVFWVDINEHFSDWSSIREIDSFYDVICRWSDSRTRKTVLSLDDFNKLLITDKKIKFFQDRFIKKMASYSDVLNLIITTRVKTLNHNFHVISADEIDRSSSMELLTYSWI